MRVVNVQHTEFGHIHAEQLHHLRAGRIRHAIISFVTVGERTFERGNEIGFRGLGLLDFEAGIRLPECQRAKILLYVLNGPCETCSPLLFEAPCGALESCAKAAVDTRNNTTADAIAWNFI